MSRAPGLFAEGRGRRFALVAGFALGQAVAAALAAFATRDVFAHWGGAGLPEAAVATLVGAAGLLAASRRRTGDLALRFVGDLSALRSWVSRGAACAVIGEARSPRRTGRRTGRSWPGNAVATHDAALAEALGHRWFLALPNPDGGALRGAWDGPLTREASVSGANSNRNG